MSKVATTIKLSDTIDQYSRKVHVNVRNGKTTMVYRWRSVDGGKSHTQRTTLSDDQAARLLAALQNAVTNKATVEAAK